MKTKLSATVAFISLFAMGAVTAQADPLPNTGGAAVFATTDARADTQAQSIFFTVEESELEERTLRAMSVTSHYGNLDTFYGNLDTFYGNLDTFWGNLDTFYGNLDTFYGNLDTFYGNLDTFWGNLDTFSGETHAFWGNLDTFYGNLDTFYGNLDTFYGNLDTFWGNLDTFYGNLDTFYGNLDTFYGNLDTFWGNLDTFEGKVEDFYGNLDTFYGNLDTFWGNLDTFWGNLDTFWGNLDTFGPGTEADWNQLLSDFGTFYAMSEEMWFVPVAAKTGKDFYSGFAKDIFDKYGIDPTDASTLAALDATDRAKFMIEWQDGLMQFSGMDRYDFWMSPINWTPALTQDHNSGYTPRIGIIDFGITDRTLVDNGQIVHRGGYRTEEGDFHGSAVASLIIAPHDGQGVMGLAPNTEIVAMNPFDDTKTASWRDVGRSLNKAFSLDARIINMSLGEPGHVMTQDFANQIQHFASNNANSTETVFILAAGNDGVTQPTHIEWDNSWSNDRFIVVGALGIDGEIAEFSNTPGESCLTVRQWWGGVTCSERNKLKYRFIVAPGEGLLVSDGRGGVTRQSGTSFAAPLVSGTAALIHSYWPWMADNAEETVNAILWSAQDLGEAGVDGVYGYGLLDVEAALSPLDWNDVKFYRDYDGDDHWSGQMSASAIQNWFLNADVLQIEADGGRLVGFEDIGATYRDFRIPLSTLIYGQNEDARGHIANQRFQRHLHQRFVDWATGNSSLTDIQSYSASMGADGEWAMSMTATPYSPGADVRDGELPFQTTLVMANAETGTTMLAGHGDGAALLNGSDVFGFYSDFDTKTGGVNPVLGLASGGTFAASTVKVSEGLSLTAAITETERDHSYVDALTEQRVDGGRGLADFAAQATQVSAKYQLTGSTAIGVAYTQLNEADSVLGDQGAGIMSLEGGATTDSVTFSADTKLGRGVSLGLSATTAKTRGTEFGGESFLALSDKGVNSTAFALGLRKDGVFGKKDHLRISVAQPLTVEQGAVELSQVEVIDRNTGELGLVTQRLNLATDRTLVAEAQYATSFMDGNAELSAFTRAEFQTGESVGQQEETDIGVGARLAFKF